MAADVGVRQCSENGQATLDSRAFGCCWCGRALHMEMVAGDGHAPFFWPGHVPQNDQSDQRRCVLWTHPPTPCPLGGAGFPHGGGGGRARSLYATPPRSPPPPPGFER